MENKILLKDLINDVSWFEIESKILELYPDDEDLLGFYKKFYFDLHSGNVFPLNKNFLFYVSALPDVDIDDEEAEFFEEYDDEFDTYMFEYDQDMLDFLVSCSIAFENTDVEEYDYTNTLMLTLFFVECYFGNIFAEVFPHVEEQLKNRP